MKRSILCVRKSTDGVYYFKRPKIRNWSRNIYLTFFFSELHQYHPGQCHLKYILSRLTGRFGSSFCSHNQANSIILTNYILRSWSRLDNEDYVMNDRPKRQLLDQHNDSCLKMEELPTRIAGFQTIYDEDVMIS
jgi:hypothetical protein